MNFITKLFGYPLGIIMWVIYSIIPNYGIALFVFTIITRLALFPVSLNQQKSSARMQMLQPEIKKIQEKYSGDNQRMNEEIQKLYDKEGYNPTSGCLPMILQFAILFGLIDVIYRPLTHIIRMPSAILTKATTLFGFLGKNVVNSNMLELEIMTKARTMPAFFASLGSTAMAQMFEIDYTFLGMNLMAVPSFDMLTGIFKGNFNPVVIIPILSGITSLIMSMVSMKSMAGAADDQSAGMMKGMMFTMPLMSVWIAFTVPAGVGLYWVYSNLWGIVQSLYMSKYHNPKDMTEKIIAERKAKEEQERQERLEARKRVKSGEYTLTDAEKALSQKEVDRMKLAAARARDAEKYGDVYSGEEADEEY